MPFYRKENTFINLFILILLIELLIVELSSFVLNQFVSVKLNLRDMIIFKGKLPYERQGSTSKLRLTQV